MAKDPHHNQRKNELIMGRHVFTDIYDRDNEMRKEVLILYFVCLQFACRTSKNPKNIIFSPWDHKNIQNDVAQPVWIAEHPKCLFQPK